AVAGGGLRDDVDDPLAIELSVGLPRHRDDSCLPGAERRQVYGLARERRQLELLDGDAGHLRQRLARVLRRERGRTAAASARRRRHAAATTATAAALTAGPGRKRIHRQHAAERPRRRAETEYKAEDRVPAFLAAVRDRRRRARVPVFLAGRIH